MDLDDKKSVGIFGFKRSKGRRKRPAVALIAVSLLVIIFAVWFMVIRH
jgi:hypothetical protein